jgi:hypothetical protein
MSDPELLPETAPEDIKQPFWYRRQTALFIGAGAIGAGLAVWYSSTHHTPPPQPPTEYEQADYEQHLGEQLTEKAGSDVTVSCPADVVMAGVGTTFVCTAVAVADGSTVDVKVTFEDSGYSWIVVGTAAS